MKRGCGLYLTPELQNSKAWKYLGKYAIHLFFDLHNELKYKFKDSYNPIKGRMKKERVYSNNGNIAFTQVQFCKKYACVKDTYTNARNQLIYVGLITITHLGGFGKGDVTKYKLEYVQHNNKSLSKGKWCDFDGDKNWEADIQKASKKLVGKKSQWKKGETGRKNIFTL